MSTANNVPMQKPIKLVFFVITLTAAIAAFSQNQAFKAGLNAAYDIADISERGTFHYGALIGYDRQLSTKWSFSASCSFQYGRHEQNYTNFEPFNTRDYMIGLQPEIRLHPENFGEGTYVGLGASLKLLIAVDYFPLEENELQPTLGTFEKSLVFTVGSTPKYEGHKISANPFADIYFDPTDRSEYIGGIRAGLNIFFGKK